MLKKLTNKKGFTLMEMLIVVAIIAVLVAIAIPTFNGALTKAKESADVANIRAAYAEWQIAILTDNVAAPTAQGNENSTTATDFTSKLEKLNYFDKFGYNPTTKVLTYGATKITDPSGSATFTWTLGEPEIK